MMQVTLKNKMGFDDTSLAKRIMDINFDAIESMEDLSTGGCRIYFRNRNEDIEVEEDRKTLLYGRSEEIDVVRSLFDETARYVGWTLVALIIIAVEMLVLIFWGK